MSYILNRLVKQMLPVLIIASILVFMVVRLIPGVWGPKTPSAPVDQRGNGHDLVFVPHRCAVTFQCMIRRRS